MKNVLIFIISFVCLSSCATAYKSQGFSGGYSETQYSENVFQVSFKGNGYTSRERASDFALLRSAEVALEHGFKYFFIVNNDNYSKNMAYTTPTHSYTSGSSFTNGTINMNRNTGTYNGTTYGSATTTTYGGQTYLISKPRTTNTILCLKEKPEGNQFVFDAEFIRNSLMTKYHINKATLQ